MNPEGAPDSDFERIEDLALSYRGEFFVGNTRAEAMQRLRVEFPDYDPAQEEAVEGFTTNKRKFVTEEEGRKIALAK